METAVRWTVYLGLGLVIASVLLAPFFPSPRHPTKDRDPEWESERQDHQRYRE